MCHYVLIREEMRLQTDMSSWRSAAVLSADLKSVNSVNQVADSQIVNEHLQ